MESFTPYIQFLPSYHKALFYTIVQNGEESERNGYICDKKSGKVDESKNEYRKTHRIIRNYPMRLSWCGMEVVRRNVVTLIAKIEKL